MEENGKLVQFIFNENKEVIAEQEDGNITRLIRTSDLWAMESEPEKTWYHYASDEQGSTIFITDRQGKVKNRYAYDAFGKRIESEEQISNHYQYTGQQFEPITQQYYLRARFYNPAIARFTQEDEYYGDGLNLYIYCVNNPINYSDSSGYCKKDIYPQVKVDREIKASIPENAKVINIEKAEDVNKWFDEGKPGYLPPYKPGTDVYRIKLEKDTTFARVYDKNNSGMYGEWIMRKEDIDGLTQKQIQDKFALPQQPIYACDVEIPKGVVLRVGKVNPIDGWGEGG